MNEYHEAFEELQDKNTFKGQQWFGERKDLVEEYSWAVPNEEVLRYLAEFDSIVEVGAGSGYWAHCINEMGGNIRATDIDPPDERWTTVEQADVINLDLNGDAVLTVWPPLDKCVAGYIPTEEPDHILYVGEPRGGCTGDDSFFERLDEQYGLVAKIEIPSYAGIHDDFYHYVRKV
jgi:hypothetical protein